MRLETLDDMLPYCLENIPRRSLAVIKPEDDHTLKALSLVKEKGVADPILIGNEKLIRGILAEIGDNPDNYQIIDMDDYKEATMKAIQMIHEKKAELIMKGTVDTKDLMKLIVARDAGMRTDRVMSKFDFMENPGYHKLFSLSDSALNPKPDVKMKKLIIENALDVLHSMGIEKPKVAVLAAAEEVNPKLQESTDAYELKKMYENGEFSPCILEGPISIDLALDPESAKIKKYPSPVGGDADLLICPDLVSGNMMGKGMLLTGAKDAGIIVGAKVPIVLTSRAASVEDKFRSILLGVIASWRK